MPETPDLDLLEEYVQQDSEAAFAALVKERQERLRFSGAIGTILEAEV